MNEDAQSVNETVQELIARVKALRPDTISYTPTAIPTVAEAAKAVENLSAAIDVHQTEYLTLNELTQAVNNFRMQLQERRTQELATLALAKDAYRLTKLREAEAALANELAPDLTNPELHKLVVILETWQHYHRLDSYQVDDIIFTLDRWLRTRNQVNAPDNLFTRGIINANDTGMGKTLESIAFLWVMRQVNPAARIIWFTKSALVKETSPESTTKWGFDMIPICGTTTPEKVNLINLMMNMSTVIPPCFAINYEAVNQNEIVQALGDKWDFMVIDEVHKLRGGANYRPTQMWTNTKAFKTRTNAWPMMLSGSIINNRSRELWAFLNIMDEERFPDVTEFEATMKVGAAAAKELMKILAPSMFRRRKDEVAIRMPERIVKKHTVTFDPNGRLNQIKLQFEEEMGAWLENQEKKQVKVSFKSILDQLIRLRGLNIAPGYMSITRTVVDSNTGEPTTIKEPLDTGEPEKLKYVAELANELLEEGQQVVIASSGFIAPLKFLKDKAIDPRFTCEGLYGSNNAIGGDIAARFRAGETQVLLTNLQSGAEGFNLHKTDDYPGGAEHLIMIDDWYNPALINQMFDRVWRRNSSSNRVIIHLIQVENSVDQFVEAIREGKTFRNNKITESTTLRAGEWKSLLMQALGKETAGTA